ncbi:MAG TPA: RNA polymerase sigma-70 factor [Puia sp.]|nr:RNA polymerase sigma-70 factor [Puia sp.]
MIKTWQDGVRNSDTPSFNSLFRHYYARLVKFAVQFVHTREAAEEIVSDVFVKIWERRSTLGEVRNLEVYLYVAVKNGCLNYCEKYSVVHLQLDMHGATELYDTGNSQKNLEMKELMHRLHMAVEQLPEQCRLIFKMVKEDNLSFREVAEILSISPRTVETQIYRAVKKLKVVLSEQTSAPTDGGHGPSGTSGDSTQPGSPNGAMILKIFFPFL